ncbi:carbohydrate ABC transporter substrate-binding protein [Paenibacillus nasutitermitis]|uniref:Lipoprotein n=1 Tax=Paenibacillus nasutitermitis TaxID=1652958 RepID=A0A917DQI2_9BACL|nr:carbohydrate ABC transporter substrate-binding protein [Paenibacillus nasutitermitis]GGD60117.1 lipoprotein [Paenibacillus nasutitermitis]
MKRMANVALATCMTMGLILAGCSDNEQPPTPTPAKNGNETPAVSENNDTKKDPAVKEFANKELALDVFDGGDGTSFWQEMVRKFEDEYPGTKITISSAVGEVFKDKIKAKFLSGNEPDFIVSPFVSTYAGDGVLAELNDVFDGKALGEERTVKEKILPALLDITTPLGDGKVYYAPTGYSIAPMYYNKKLFADKGWTAPKTWDEFFAMGELAKADGKSLYTYQGNYPGYIGQILLPMINSHAGDAAMKKIFNYEQDAWKDPKVKEVLEVIHKLVSPAYLLPGTTGLTHKQAQQAVLDDKALFIQNGTWFENEMKDTIPATFEFGSMGAPVFSGDTPYAQGSNGWFFIPKKAKNLELAKEFLRYIYTDENLKLHAQMTGEVPATVGGLELVKEYLQPSVVEALSIFDTHKITSADGWATLPPTSITTEAAIYNPITSMANGKLTVDQWVDKIEASFAIIRKERDAAAK